MGLLMGLKLWWIILMRERLQLRGLLNGLRLWGILLMRGKDYNKQRLLF